MLMAAGMLLMLGMLYFVFAGPSPAKAQARRLEGFDVVVGVVEIVAGVLVGVLDSFKAAGKPVEIVSVGPERLQSIMEHIREPCVELDRRVTVAARGTAVDDRDRQSDDRAEVQAIDERNAELLRDKAGTFNAVYIMAETYLFRSAPWATVKPTDEGVLTRPDFDVDVGKVQAEVSFEVVLQQCHRRDPAGAHTLVLLLELGPVEEA